MVLHVSLLIRDVAKWFLISVIFDNSHLDHLFHQIWVLSSPCSTFLRWQRKPLLMRRVISVLRISLPSIMCQCNLKGLRLQFKHTTFVPFSPTIHMPAEDGSLLKAKTRREGVVVKKSSPGGSIGCHLAYQVHAYREQMWKSYVQKPTWKT